MIVTVLSDKTVTKYYRFYGERHSILQLGYLIDFEIKESNNFLPQLRGISHNGFQWLYNREKLLKWHKLITTIEPHFRDVNEISSFYYNILLNAAKKWSKQSAKRLSIEVLIKILKFEGRLQPLNKCVICNQLIEDNISLIDGFLPTHSSCSSLEAINKNALIKLFNNSTTILLDDNIIDRVYLIALKSF